MSLAPGFNLASKEKDSDQAPLNKKQVEKMIFTNPLVKQLSSWVKDGDAERRKLKSRVGELEKKLSILGTIVGKEKRRRMEAKKIMAHLIMEQDQVVNEMRQKMATFEMELFEARRKFMATRRNERLESMEDDEEGGVPEAINVETGENGRERNQTSGGADLNNGGGAPSAGSNPVASLTRKRPRTSDVSGIETVVVPHVGEVNVAALFSMGWDDEDASP